MTGEDLEKYLKKLANEMAEKANECCHRSDGYEEEIRSIALKALWLVIAEKELNEARRRR